MCILSRNLIFQTQAFFSYFTEFSTPCTVHPYRPSRLDFHPSALPPTRVRAISFKNDVILTVIFDCVFLSNTRVRKKKKGEERNSYLQFFIFSGRRNFWISSFCSKSNQRWRNILSSIDWVSTGFNYGWM